MNKLALLILSTSLLFSCKSVTKDIAKEKNESSEIFRSENSSQVEKNISTETKSESNSKFDLTKFSVVPVNGFADFEFNFNGQVLSGKTTGVLNFSNEKKEGQNKSSTKIQQLEIWKTFKKTYTITKKYTETITRTIERKVEFSFQFWILLVLGIIIGWEAIKKAISTALKSTWWLSFINRLKKVR